MLGSRKLEFAIIQVGNNEASNRYVRNKVKDCEEIGIIAHVYKFDEDISRLAGEAPDNDGTVLLGWEVFHPLWYGENEIDKYELAAVLAVRPCWIVYGK